MVTKSQTLSSGHDKFFFRLQTYTKYLLLTDKLCIVMHSHLGTVYTICHIILTDRK